MKLLYIFFLMPAFLIYPFCSKAQNREANYHIYKYAEDIPDAKIASLNWKIAKKTDEDEVFGIIDRELKKWTGEKVKIKKPFNGNSFLSIEYTIGRIEKPEPYLKQWNVARGSDDLLVSIQALTEFFPDTLYIIDTLNIAVAKTSGFAPEGYRLTVEPNSPAGAGLRFRNNLLQLFPLSGEKGRFISCTLEHDQPPYAPVHFTLLFLDDQKEQALKDDKKLLLMMNGGKIEKAGLPLFAEMLSAYFTLRYGTIKPRNILDWLNKK